MFTPETGDFQSGLGNAAHVGITANQGDTMSGFGQHTPNCRADRTGSIDQDIHQCIINYNTDMNDRTRSGWLLILFFLGGCATTPYTKRHQLMMISPQEEDQMGGEAYQDVLKKSKISNDPAAKQMIDRIGARIAQAADKPDYHWQFTLIDDPKTINAFCLPGGRVAVYSGILPITQTEEGLAVVMSHEVAHALARHGAERISDQLAAGVVLGTAFGSASAETQALIGQAYGIGVELPFSRSQESEADHIGLILMAKAGYDPHAAVTFWERMAQAMAGKAPPVFLSDHPSDAQRIAKIKKQLPEALTYYKP
jgi:predicted Zn-dependent protease